MNQILPQMGVVVGIPTSRPVVPEWAVALATQSWPSNTNVCYAPIRGMARDQARNLIVESAQKLRSKYVAMLDDDVEIPFGAFRQLMKTLAEADDDVMAVGAIYPSRKGDPHPIVYMENGAGPYWRWKKDTVFECELIGTGCVIFKTEAFNYVPKPWFKDVDTPTIQITDDAWFFGQLRAAGYKILADAHVICTHWDNQTQTPHRFPEDCYPMLPFGKEHLFKSLPQGWMTIPELSWLSENAAKHQHIVELGSFMGRSTVVMAKSTSGKVWAIDDWKGPRNTAVLGPEQRLIEYNVDHSGLLAQFKQNTADLNNVECIVSDHAQADIPVSPDMVFVDGDHEYESVKRDIVKWKSKVVPGGLLCGHDRNWEGVAKAITELLTDWKPEPGSLWSCQL